MNALLEPISRTESLLELPRRFGVVQPHEVIWFGLSPIKEESAVEAYKDLDLGLGGNFIMGFADVLLERGQNPYQLCFYSFFTSIKLMSTLKKKGVRATGLIRENRTDRCPLMNTEHGKK